ncbi:MAG: two-component regulator propeller domain-containing protein [Bacteroidota bacterium]
MEASKLATGCHLPGFPQVMPWGPQPRRIGTQVPGGVGFAQIHRKRYFQRKYDTAIIQPRFLLLFCCLTSLVWGQQLPFRHYSVEDGLPSMTLYRILQARDGRLWLGTDRGVSRFDGHRFQNFGPADGMPGSEVVQMALDTADRLWIGTFSGQIAFRENDRFRTHWEAPWIPEIGGVPRALGSTRRGTMLVATRGHCWQFSPSYQQKMRAETRGDPILAFVEGAEGELLVLDRKGRSLPGFAPNDSTGLPDKLSAYTRRFFEQNGSGVIQSAEIAAIREDREFIRSAIAAMRTRCPKCRITTLAYGPGMAELWVGTLQNGLFLVNRRTRALVQPLESGNVITLVCDRAGNVWVGTGGNGLFLFRRSDRAAFYLNETNGLPENQCDFLAVPAPGRLLVGHSTGRPSWVATGDLRVYPFPEFFSSKRRKLKFAHRFADGELLLGMDGSVIMVPDAVRERAKIRLARPVFSERSDVSVARRLGAGDAYPLLSAGAFKDLAVVGDSLWYISTNLGLYRCEKAPDSVHCQFCYEGRVEALAYEKARERLWMSSIDSLLIVRRGKVTGGMSLSALGSRVPFMEADPADGVWLGTQDNGVFHFAERGVAHFERGSGLPSNHCTALHITADGRLLIGTDRGLAVLDLPFTGDRAPEFWYHDRRTGLIDNHVRDVAVSGDTVWLATAKGLAFWIPEMNRAAASDTGEPGSTTPRLKIVSVQINGRDTTRQPAYRLAYWQNSCTIRCFDPEYKADAFQYRCLGLDTNWRDLSAPVLQLPFLAPGQTYEIQLRARHAFRAWGPPTTLVLDIRKAFFQTTLFYFLLGSLLLGALGAIWGLRQRNRIRILRERARFRQQRSKLRLTALKARMNPHFIFNSLNAIQHFVSVGRDRETFDYIASFSKLMRLILERSDQDLISLGEEIEICELYLAVEAQRLHEDFHYSVEVAPDLLRDALYIPTMIVQPFLENAIWHGLMPKASDRQLRLIFRAEGEQLQVIIEDNGIGRAAAEARKSTVRRAFPSRSTQIFAQRLELLNQSFRAAPFTAVYTDLTDPAGQPAGTRLCLQFPFLRHPIEI